MAKNVIIKKIKNPKYYPAYKTAALVILAIASGLFGGWIYNSYMADKTIYSSTSNQQRVVSSQEQVYTSVAKAVGPSVVSIDVSANGQSAPNFFGMTSPTTLQSAGTGVVVSSAGLIVTNRHVVPSGTTKISVTLDDGTTFNNVKLIGSTSAQSSLDIAFLQIEDLGSKKLTPATLGDSSQVVVGQEVLAIGNALGQFQNTVTQGIISGFGRSITAGDGSSSNTENLQDLFQTDAAINPGNSGGPLVDLSGNVIGINTAIAGNAQNIGFSIPINEVKGLIKSVETTGQIKQAYLGVSYVPITNDYAYTYNLPVTSGAYVAPSNAGGNGGVIADGPAANAGLKEKDIITKVNDQSINAQNSLSTLINQYQPGDNVTLTILRDGKTMTLKVKLGTMPSSSQQ